MDTSIKDVERMNTHYDTGKMEEYIEALNDANEFEIYDDNIRFNGVSYELIINHQEIDHLVIPEILYEELKVLDLSNNQFSTITIEGLENLSNIHLRISHNKIRSLDGVDLSMVNELYMDNNSIRALPDDLAQMNPRILDLSYNRISKLPQTLSSMDNVRILLLRNNDITLLPKDLPNLFRLRQLDISGNRIHTLPEGFFNLHSLDISNNHSMRLNEAFKHLTSIKSLYLEGMNLSEIPEFIYDLKTLEKIHFKNNMINYVDRARFTQEEIEIDIM